MMKRRISTILLAGLLLLFVFPMTSYAQGASQRQELFCSLQAERQSTMTDAFKNRVEAYEKALEIQTNNKVERRKKIEEELAAERAKADVKRSESYRLIKEKQGTEEGKTLAEAYAQEVDAAITKRREAYDNARQAFHSAIDNLLADRDQGVRSAAHQFKESAATAMDQATLQCQSDRENRGEIRRALIEELREARLAYGDVLRSRKDFRAGVRTAIESRNKAYREATTEFQQAMQLIREKYTELRN